MKPAALILVLFLGTAVTAAAQEQSAAHRSFTHITQLGIGSVHQQDTYLSPLGYSGTQGHYMHQRQQPLHWLQGRTEFRSLFHLEGSYTKNRPRKGSYIGGSVRYDASWLFQLPPLGSRWAWAIGPQIGGTAGFLYNTRSGNNPAQALADIHLAASAAVSYTFPLWRRSFKVSNQTDVPMVGVMFSPNYGQSYYEIFSEGNTDHNICVTSPFNAPSLRNQLSLDFPLWRFTFRATYLIDVRQSHVNSIKHHSYSHAFMIGWVKHLYAE